MKKRTSYRDFIMTEDQMKRLNDHLGINTSKDPIPISGKTIIQGLDVNGEVFTASATDCKLRFENPLGEDQQKDLFIANEKAERIMKNVSAAFSECASKLSKEHPLGEVVLEVGDDITVTVQIELAPDAEQK